ncbi:hypothetical protein EDL98_03000 [Ornithobacterium rhinotracheale]|uniref:hypothetical protein n=1 Tax=Ornithobacterium rhinotracheale TaxID=28251 RepID=UPI00129C12C2|nr:hypothetical protein [Ornithobacterium rhinotracheale]MRJ10051.1 hypothetical protein [Ornithobacterium rhinotracheale]
MNKKYILSLALLAGISLQAQENYTGGVAVGAGVTESTVPQATLDIRGNLKVDNPKPYDGTQSIVPLYRGATSKIIVANKNTKKLMYTFNLKVPTTKVGEDFQPGYDTGIDFDKYYVFLTSSNIYSSDGSAVSIKHHNFWRRERGNPIKIDYLKKGANNTWEIYLDYNQAGPENTSLTYYWKCQLVAIDKRYIKQIEAQKVVVPSAGSEVILPSNPIRN